jgi:hypothetical protein
LFGYSEVLIVGAIMGQMKLTKPQAANACAPDLQGRFAKRNKLLHTLRPNILAPKYTPLTPEPENPGVR